MATVKDLEKNGTSIVFAFANGYSVQAIFPRDVRTGITASYWPSGHAGGPDSLLKLEKAPGVGLIDEDFVEALAYVNGLDRREGIKADPETVQQAARDAAVLATKQGEIEQGFVAPEDASGGVPGAAMADEPEVFEDAGEPPSWSTPDDEPEQAEAEPQTFREAVSETLAQGDAVISSWGAPSEPAETQAEPLDWRVTKLATMGVLLDGTTPLPMDMPLEDQNACMALITELGGKVEQGSDGVWRAISAPQAKPW